MVIKVYHAFVILLVPLVSLSEDALLDREYEGVTSHGNISQYNFHLNITGAEYVIRVHVALIDPDKDHSLQVVVRQQDAVTSFQVPVIVKNIIVYNAVSRTLCPIILRKTSPPEFNVQLSTFSSLAIRYKFRAERVRYFDLSPNNPMNVVILPAQPVYFRYRFLEDCDTVTVKTVSQDNVCMVLSLQDLQCPVDDGLDATEGTGLYQTVTSLGAVSTNTVRYPNGFFVVLVLQSTDYMCTGIERLLPVPTSRTTLVQPNYRSKNVTLAVYPAPNHWYFLVPTLGAVGFFALFYVAAIGCICIYQYYDRIKSEGHRRATERQWLISPHDPTVRPVSSPTVTHPRSYGTNVLPPISIRPLPEGASLTSEGIMAREAGPGSSVTRQQPSTVPPSWPPESSNNQDISMNPPVGTTSVPKDVTLFVPRRSASCASSRSSRTNRSCQSASRPVFDARDLHGWFSSSEDEEQEGQFVGYDPSAVGPSEPAFGFFVQRPSSEVVDTRKEPAEQENHSDGACCEPLRQRITSGELVKGVGLNDREEVTQTETVYSGSETPFDVVHNYPVLFLSDLSKKRYTTLNRKYILYFWYLIIVSIFYGLPVVQLIMIYQKTVTETGNEDLCYYNFECARPLGIFTAFNNVFSNIGYVMLGLLFLALTARKDIIYRRLRRSGPDRLLNLGIPQHYGLYYAMGLALAMEGVMSACYHMCPSFSNFQFDTAFMYILSTLIMLKIYQTRHPDINASAHSAYMVMAVVIFLGVAGVFYGGETFWIAFTVFFLLMSIVLTAEIYYMGQWNIDLCLPRRLYALIRSDGIHCLRPTYLERMILLLIANLVNFALAGFGIVDRPMNFSSFLLSVFMINVLMYTFFYILMKLFHRERLLPLPLVFLFLTCASWSCAIYFYFRRVTTWEVTPAQSRTFNQPCILLSFYDAHDVWHFTSAISMFFSFMMLMSLDDDLASRPRNEIPVF